MLNKESVKSTSSHVTTANSVQSLESNLGTSPLVEEQKADSLVASSDEIIIDCNTREGKELLTRPSKTKLSGAFKLDILSVDKLSDQKSINQLNEFLNKTVSGNIEYFSFNRNGGTRRVDEFVEALSEVLSKVRQEVVLYNLSLTQEELKMIFQSCYKVKSLIFYKCKFGKVVQDFR